MWASAFCRGEDSWRYTSRFSSAFNPTHEFLGTIWADIFPIQIGSVHIGPFENRAYAVFYLSADIATFLFAHWTNLSANSIRKSKSANVGIHPARRSFRILASRIRSSSLKTPRWPWMISAAMAEIGRST
jgi:hypothetical protein